MRRRGFEMGLEQDIKDAFITNLTYKVDKKDVNPIAGNLKAEKKINQLSENLSKAIIDFIKAQISIDDLVQKIKNYLSTALKQ